MGVGLCRDGVGVGGVGVGRIELVPPATGPGLTVGVGVVTVTDVGAKLMLAGFVSVSTLYTHQPAGKVKVFTTCPAGFTSTNTAPVSLKPHVPSGSLFSGNWCVGVPKSPKKSPFGRCTIAPPYWFQMEVEACQLQITLAVMLVSLRAISIKLLRQSLGLELFLKSLLKSMKVFGEICSTV